MNLDVSIYCGVEKFDNHFKTTIRAFDAFIISPENDTPQFCDIRELPPKKSHQDDSFLKSPRTFKTGIGFSHSARPKFLLLRSFLVYLGLISLKTQHVYIWLEWTSWQARAGCMKGFIVYEYI